MTSNFSRFVTRKRQRDSSIGDRGVILESESDRGRLLFSAAFRRLQQKAQVFSLEQNAAVRSRLTHSLEVSQIGRYIADKVVDSLLVQKSITDDEAGAIVRFVETACLMHDIGNPPFGHFGEAAISEWFREHALDIVKTLYNIEVLEAEEELSDFLEFDGNPQGLRVVCKLQRNKDEYGLNLTYTSYATYLKYIRTSGNEYKRLNINKFVKKCGYFKTERNLIQNVWSHFGFSKPQRFPLTYLMEAADDIAYCISDLDDSIEKELIKFNDSLEFLYTLWCQKNSDKESEEYRKIYELLVEKKPETIIDFRTRLINILVDSVATIFVENAEAITKGEMDSLIDKNSAAGSILECIKKYCRDNVYCHRTVQKTELVGYTAIYGLLDKFRSLLTISADRFEKSLNYENKDSNGNQILIEKKYLKLFPKNYIQSYQEELSKLEVKDGIGEWLLRAHLIVDYISGMTDDFALETYRSLSGINAS